MTVQIREINLQQGGVYPITSNITEDTLEFRVLEEYSFPEGFSNPIDWFVRPYSNIPPEGISGVVYRPIPHNACTDSLSQSFGQSRNFIELNLSRLALVDEYHTCTDKKLRTLKAAGYHGMITFSTNDTDRNVDSRVLDSSTNTFVDVISSGFPTLVVSEHFASVLLKEAVIFNESLYVNSTDRLNKTLVFVSIHGDPTRQGWIGFGVAVAIVVILIGIPVFTCLCICCCLCCLCAGGRMSCSNDCCNCKVRRKSGMYDVHQVHIRVLGDDLVLRQPTLEEESSLSVQADNNPRSATVQLERFQRILEDELVPKTRKYNPENERNISCAICLEEFKEEATIHSLSCDENHVFHPQCIELWLETHSVCPICRTFIVRPNF